jgi:hypothetical protein
MAVNNRGVIELLARAPVPTMPAHLAARVHAAIAAESAKRSAERTARMRALGEQIEDAAYRHRGDGDIAQA